MFPQRRETSWLTASVLLPHARTHVSAPLESKALKGVHFPRRARPDVAVDVSELLTVFSEFSVKIRTNTLRGGEMDKGWQNLVDLQGLCVDSAPPRCCGCKIQPLPTQWDREVSPQVARD